MKVGTGLGLPDLVLCPECEKAVKQEKGRFCKGCSHKVREYQEKHNLVIDFWMGGAQGEQGESCRPGMWGEKDGNGTRTKI